METQKIGNLWVDYDEEADVLYTSVGAPTPCRTRELRNDVLIREDTATKAIVAATILNYRGNFRELSDVLWLRASGLPEELTTYLENKPEF